MEGKPKTSKKENLKEVQIEFDFSAKTEPILENLSGKEFTIPNQEILETKIFSETLVPVLKKDEIKELKKEKVKKPKIEKEITPEEKVLRQIQHALKIYLPFKTFSHGVTNRDFWQTHKIRKSRDYEKRIKELSSVVLEEIKKLHTDSIYSYENIISRTEKQINEYPNIKEFVNLLLRHRYKKGGSWNSVNVSYAKVTESPKCIISNLDQSLKTEYNNRGWLNDWESGNGK